MSHAARFQASAGQNNSKQHRCWGFVRSTSCNQPRAACWMTPASFTKTWSASSGRSAPSGSSRGARNGTGSASVAATLITWRPALPGRGERFGRGDVLAVAHDGGAAAAGARRGRLVAQGEDVPGRPVVALLGAGQGGLPAESFLTGWPPRAHRPGSPPPQKHRPSPGPRLPAGSGRASR